MFITLFTTGGTIDKTYFDQKDAYHVGQTQVPGLFERANVVVDYEVIELMQKDSLDMDDHDRAQIKAAVEATDSKQIIITHGTDTMVNTAQYLGKLPGKTIIFTGSMLPAQYRDSDAIFNLGGALIAAQTLQPGTYLVINGQVFDPAKALKNVGENQFESELSKR